MSIYADLNCLFHAISSNNANEVDFIVRHNTFVSNAYLALALEKGHIAAAGPLLKHWDFSQEPSLPTFIATVDDPTFAQAAVERIADEVLPFSQWIVEAARLGRASWVKALAPLAEDQLWNTPDFNAEISFWTNAAHESKDTLSLLVEHMGLNLQAMAPALHEAQEGGYNEAVELLTPLVQRLETIECAAACADSDDVEGLKLLFATMSERDIGEVYGSAKHEGLPSTWLAALPSLDLMTHHVPWLLSEALLKKDTPAVDVLLKHYTVVSADDREKRKYEPKPLSAALNNLERLKYVLELFPADHPHIAAAVNTAATNRNIPALTELLAHSPNVCGQALFSSLSTYNNIPMSTMLLEQCDDTDVDMCVRMMKHNHIALPDQNQLKHLIEPRLERLRLNTHIGGHAPASVKRKM